MRPEQIYSKLPVFAQNIACCYYGLKEKRKRLGAPFRDYYSWLRETEAASAHDIEHYQSEKIRSLIDSVLDDVPFYRSKLAEQGVSAGDIRSKDDLKKLPILTKAEVIANRARLLADKFDKKKLFERRTSGTTGTALRFFSSRDAIAFQWAVWWRHRSRFGVEPNTWHLNFTGKPVVPVNQKTPPYWRWNWPLRQALVNMQHITPEKISTIAGFAGRQNFRFYSGYPSIIHSFTRMIEEAGIELSNKPEIIFLGAENVQIFQKESISRVLGATVTDQYGISEGCANASRCEYGNYHEDWEFCALECADPEPMPDGGIRGRIVATGFAERAFPFIRYETGDFAVWAPPEFRCPCGRQSPVITQIEGRIEDYVVTPEGHRVMRFDYLFKETDSIVEAQVIQETPGEICILVVPRPDFSAKDVEHLRTTVAGMISPSLKVNVETVSEIPRSASGKFRPVVSKLSHKL